MGDKISLNLDERSVHGKKVARLRRDNLVPGVVYGQGFEPISVQAVQQVIDKVYRAAGKHHPVHITIGSKKKIAMIKDVDVDPLKNVVRHVAFHARVIPDAYRTRTRSWVGDRWALVTRVTSTAATSGLVQVPLAST